MHERAVSGYQALADMLGCHIRTVKRRRPELVRLGIVFYMMEGKPPRKVLKFFPSTVRAYCMRKTQEGEMI